MRSSEHRSTKSTESAAAKGLQRESLWLSLLLGFVLIRGLLQVAAVPPWQHYDEPGHFEYAWLIANRSQGSTSGAGLLVWGNTLFRPHPVLLSQGNLVFLPVARYAYPVVIPTALALMGGWLTLVPPRARKWAVTALAVGLVLLDAISLVTIILFYHGE